MLAAVEERQGPRGEGRCAGPGCGAVWTEVDHLLARTFGGTDEPENLQGLCRRCNAAKGAGPVVPTRVVEVAEGQPSRRWLG